MYNSQKHNHPNDQDDDEDDSGTAICGDVSCVKEQQLCQCSQREYNINANFWHSTIQPNW